MAPDIKHWPSAVGVHVQMQYCQDILGAFNFGCCSWGQYLVEQGIWTGPYVAGVVLVFFRGWFTLLHTAATVLEVGSLILLFKSDMLDNVFSALHNATKIRHKVIEIKE